jgi:hypothetical protein
MKSEILKNLLEEMDADPWHVKFRRWVSVQWWVIKCIYFRKQK